MTGKHVPANVKQAERRLERLRPAQINALMEESPIVFMPIGAIEWHGWHAPVGLDSLVAHAACLRVAQRVGGIVFPSFYYGMYGSIAANPWTILVEDKRVITGALSTTLKRLEESGVKVAVIYSGHFALKQIEMLREIQTAWESSTHVMKLVTLVGGDLPNPLVPPDHGGLFETSLLSVLCPETLDLSQLPTQSDYSGDEPGQASNGPQRRDPSHPLFGIMGTDPRSVDSTQAQQLTTQLVDWISQRTNDALS